MAADTINDQYLAFQLDRESYAISVASINSVVEYSEITHLPKMPEYVPGVINLRGRVVPIIDLRRKFGLPVAERTLDSRIVVIERIVNESEVVWGILADSVDEVIDLDPLNIQATPDFGTAVDTDFILGVGKRGDKFLIILDIQKVLSVDDLGLVSKASSETEDSGARASSR